MSDLQHPDITRTLRTGYPDGKNSKPIKNKPGEYWDPIDWIKSEREKRNEQIGKRS